MGSGTGVAKGAVTSEAPSSKKFSKDLEERIPVHDSVEKQRAEPAVEDAQHIDVADFKINRTVHESKDECRQYQPIERVMQKTKQQSGHENDERV